MENKDYVSLETAKLLKEVGYDGQCLCFYSTIPSKLRSNNPLWTFEISTLKCSYNITPHTPHIIDAPHLYKAQKWLREVHKMYISIDYNCVYPCMWSYDIYKIPINDKMFETYEQALDAAIQEACNLIINSKI